LDQAGTREKAAATVVGAAAFLAASMNMPMTAVLLVLEFTRVSHDYCVPIFLAVAGSTCALRTCATILPRLMQPARIQRPGACRHLQPPNSSGPKYEDCCSPRYK